MNGLVRVSDGLFEEYADDERRSREENEGH